MISTVKVTSSPGATTSSTLGVLVTVIAGATGSPVTVWLSLLQSWVCSSSTAHAVTVLVWVSPASSVSGRSKSNE